MEVITLSKEEIKFIVDRLNKKDHKKKGFFIRV